MFCIIYLSIDLSIPPNTHPPMHPSTILSIQPIDPLISTHPPIYPPIHPSIHPTNIHHYIHPSIYPSLHRSNHLLILLGCRDPGSYPLETRVMFCIITNKRCAAEKHSMVLSEACVGILMMTWSLWEGWSFSSLVDQFCHSR